MNAYYISVLLTEDASNGDIVPIEKYIDEQFPFRQIYKTKKEFKVGDISIVRTNDYALISDISNVNLYGNKHMLVKGSYVRGVLCNINFR